MDIDNLSKKEVIKLSRQDKASLIKEKSAKVKFTDSVVHVVAIPLKEATSKAADPESLAAKDTVDVTMVCNTAWFCDSQMDVLTSDSYTNSVNAKGISIPHIADHKQSSTAHVGDVTKVYTKELNASELGFEGTGKTTALVMESTVRKDYNDDVFKFYKNGKINQHSIGLRYVDIRLAIDSEDDEDKQEKENWDFAYENILNKEAVDKKGYFWLVKEIDIIENSCVLFGANSLTPTLEVKSDSIQHKHIPQPTKVGKTMDLTQALAANAELSAEVASLKAEVLTSGTKAASEEQARILGILKSASTLKLDQAVAVKRIVAKTSVEDATSMFEDIAEAVQKSNHVDTDTGLESTINNDTVPPAGEKSFLSSFEEALDAVDKADAGKVSWGNL